MRSWGDAYNHFCCAFLQHLQSPAALPPRLLHHGAIKLATAPMHNLLPLAQSLQPTVEKKQR
jgi:hypothetical protein